jgi:hypothetical protein
VSIILAAPDTEPPVKNLPVNSTQFGTLEIEISAGSTQATIAVAFLACKDMGVRSPEVHA